MAQRSEHDDSAEAPRGSSTGTVPGGPLDALAAVAEVVARRYGEAHGQDLTAPRPVVWWALDDGTRLSATAGAESRAGTPVTLDWEDLASHEDAATASEQLGAMLDAARPAVVRAATPADA